MSTASDAFAQKLCDALAVPSPLCTVIEEGKVEVKDVRLADVADIYVVVFGAYWCPPARTFFGILKDAIEVMRDGRKIAPANFAPPPEVEVAKPAGRSRKNAAAQREQERAEAERVAALAAEEALELPKRRVAAVLLSHDSDATSHAKAAVGFPGYTIPYGDPRSAELYKVGAPPGLPYVTVVDAVQRKVVFDDAAAQIRGVRLSLRDSRL